MAPLSEAFHPSELESRIQYVPNGKKRKKTVGLKDCQLKEMIQYNCNLTGPKSNPKSSVECEPMLRLFRQCANGLTVETTSWEDVWDGSLKRDEVK